MSKQKYITPTQHLFPVHMVRPRFKSTLEEVLFFIASEISSFDEYVNDADLDALLMNFDLSSKLVKKTRDNWRTEISALFGLFQYDENGKFPSLISKRLSEKQDLIEFFKNYVIKMQFPNGFSKLHKVIPYINNDVKFKPYDVICNFLLEVKENDAENAYLTKEEVTFVLFDDLRFSANKLPLQDAISIIIDNRNDNVTYSSHPSVDKSFNDQTRAAHEFLDYMEYANILKSVKGKYYINELESSFIQKSLLESKLFIGFDAYYNKKIKTISCFDKIKVEWSDYVNSLDFNMSETSVQSFIKSNNDDEVIIDKNNKDKLIISTKDIGDMGEDLIISHEKKKLLDAGLGHNSHLVKFMPTHLALGYDIKSMDEEDNQIYIEVKTTLSNKKVTQNRFHLTKNEWNAAYTNRDKYFVYRLIITKESKELFIINDPVGKFMNDRIKINSPHGFDIIFNNESGYNERLLEL
ncbi:protein NO VEIN domain-containing protein [Aliivibrio sp. S10_S31]|uniref:protein NO VEIN domain-containing protein n=1 Tax=Aliivibrio sp. S10_S31 TaxID=2720224 RepID=UPI0016811994|nr:DUF3883 domain-containing protein [Aliivibrio sp. S10_S31]MBD1570334.1 DUF3883 domain-containing protein [Aliivibrio sp. S10_S31]